MHPLDRVNLTLLLIAVALGAGILATPGKNRVASPLTTISPDSVSTISLYAGEQLKWAALRANSDWTLTHPEVANADNDRVGQLLKLLATPSVASVAVAPDKLADFGVAPPAYRVIFDETEIEFGILEPTSGGRYVRVNDQVHIIGDGFLHHLLAPAAQFRAGKRE